MPFSRKPSAPATKSKPDDWLSARRFAVVLALLVFAAFPQIVLGVESFVYRDFGIFSYPLAQYLRERFWHGEIPLWNPLNNCGIPFLAQWNTQALYPPALFYLVFPLSWSLGVFCLLHLFWGGLGMFLLARDWTKNSFAAAFAGIVFAFNGLMLNSLIWPATVAALGWMPWVVRAVEQSRSGGGRKIFSAAIIGALQMLTGGTEAVLFTWIVSGVLALPALLNREAPLHKILGRMFAVVLLVTDGLDRDGHGDTFALCILSDTPAGPAADAEERAVAAFRAADPAPIRIRYRRRAENTGFKAGNIMDFLDHHADGFELMLTLDADSEVSPAAALRMVRAMQAGPRLGIVQHLTVGLPATSAFPRLFQFGMRAGMRSWATGQAWWQDESGPYWGHNAVVRIAPFRTHCRLEPLPDGRAILSHDQVEAARLAAAGWAVRLLADETGSQEANPPGLPEFMRRDARWLAGNFQYFALLRQDLTIGAGFAPMGRWQLVQAILLFAGAPLYLIFLLAAAAATDGASFPAGPVLAVSLAWPGMLYAPKLLAYLEILLSTPKSRLYGGRGRFLAGIAAETVFSLLLDATAGVSKTLAMLRLAFGFKETWAAQNRAGRGVGWIEAARLLWPHTLVGVVVFAAFWEAGWRAALWAIPFAGGLLVAIPLCVLTADPRFGTWLQRRGLAAIPEECETG